MSSGAPSVDEGPPRKRIRKGTRSCWECKRRKVRCQLSSEDVPVCSGCLARGTTCLSQEYPEERDSSGGNQIGERLGRVEHLLETLVSKISAYEEEEQAQKILTPESSNNDILTPFPPNASSNMNSLADNAPFLSLFDNSVIGRFGNTTQHLNNSAQTPQSQAAGCRTPSCIVPKNERIRQVLLDLLPSQKDTDLICSASSSFLLIHALTVKRDSAVAAATFDILTLQKSSPTIIARTVLYLAVCLQQLDQNFDTSRLQMYPSVDARMERYISVVQSLVTSDDELVSSVEGLECLVLLGLFHINAGNPRRAWLIFRKSMNIGQLMGIDRNQGSGIPGGQDMWYQIMQGERYLCLLLGLPAGCADGTFRPDETFDNPNIDRDMLFTRKLCAISGRIIERNQGDNTHAYAITQNIDEQLDSLAKEVGQEWWDLPETISNDRSRKSAVGFDRLMSQIWFFQLEALLHLPFMLRASTERRYDYSKFTCLKASREGMYRYLLLRTTESKSFCCNVVDFGALTATVTIFLGLLEAGNGETQEQKQQREADRALVQTVLASMEELASSRKDVVAMQSVNVIKALLAFDSSDGHSGGNFKLTIPYFGTISIVKSQMMTPQGSNTNTPSYLSQPPQHQSVSIDHQLPTGSWPGVTFTPSIPSQPQVNIPMASLNPAGAYAPLGQGPLMDESSWDLAEVDTMFFDSLMSTDIEGNWVL